MQGIHTLLHVFWNANIFLRCPINDYSLMHYYLRIIQVLQRSKILSLKPVYYLKVFVARKQVIPQRILNSFFKTTLIYLMTVVYFFKSSHLYKIKFVIFQYFSKQHQKHCPKLCKNMNYSNMTANLGLRSAIYLLMKSNINIQNLIFQPCFVPQLCAVCIATLQLVLSHQNNILISF